METNVNVEEKVRLRLEEAYRLGAAAAGLLGPPSGGLPALKHLDYELGTISVEKLRLFISTFVKVALA